MIPCIDPHTSCSVRIHKASLKKADFSVNVANVVLFKSLNTAKETVVVINHAVKCYSVCLKGK